MRSVRCDVCGTKALMAASQCPKCGHGFEVRNGFGELLPLAHCASCDSYYPEHVGSCRWCGTKPERSPIGAYVWKGLGVLTFASLAIGAWLVHDDTPATGKAPARTFVADTLPTNQPKAESYGRKVVVQIDSATPARDSTGVASADSTRETAVALASVAAVDSVVPTPPPVASEPVVVQSAGTVLPAEPIPPADNPPPEPPRVVRRTESAPAPAVAPPRSSARARERVTPRTTTRPPARALAKAPARVSPAPKATTKSKSSGRWVTSVARNWAVVRSDPTRQSRILAAIGPNTRVQLGETRGAWRRIKTKGLAGWVEHRTLGARPATPRKSGRLAAR